MDPIKQKNIRQNKQQRKQSKRRNHKLELLRNLDQLSEEEESTATASVAEANNDEEFIDNMSDNMQQQVQGEIAFVNSGGVYGPADDSDDDKL